MDLLTRIDTKVDILSTHFEYTKKGVEENKNAIDKIEREIMNNTADIKSINEWRVALDKIVWEILKPPLKFVGVSFFLVVALVGGWILLK